MDLSLSPEEREIRDWVRTFVTKEIIPLEQTVLERERRNERGLTIEELRGLQAKARESGFFGVQTPEEYGGMGLGAVMAALIEAELGRSFVPFKFGGDADNILFHANEEQKAAYLKPTIEGETISCFAITEPGAGSDARNIAHHRRARRRRVGDQRREDVHHRRRRRRLHDGLRGHRQGEGRRRRGHLLPRRPRSRLDVRRRSRPWASGGRRRCRSRTCGCRTPRSSARRAAASSSR